MIDLLDVQRLIVFGYACAALFVVLTVWAIGLWLVGPVEGRSYGDDQH